MNGHHVRTSFFYILEQDSSRIFDSFIFLRLCERLSPRSPAIKKEAKAE